MFVFVLGKRKRKLQFSTSEISLPLFSFMLLFEKFNSGMMFWCYHLPLFVTSCPTGVGAVVRARVLNCVDGVNIALLEKAITEQRNFFTERERKLGAHPADAT